MSEHLALAMSLIGNQVLLVQSPALHRMLLRHLRKHAHPISEHSAGSITRVPKHSSGMRIVAWVLGLRRKERFRLIILELIFAIEDILPTIGILAC